jgi:LPXTG-site transpeptidase (sortase) family protein
MKQGLGAKLAYYGTVGVLNVAVGVMFYAVNMQAPYVAAASEPLHHLPTRIRPIPATQGLPTRIVIPSLGIDLPVKVGSYDAASGNWTLDTSAAYYADTSMPINNSNGVTLIYGHAQSPVFARLPDIQPQAAVSIYTDSGYLFHYRYQTLRQVDPSDTSVFTASGPPTLTLQTCIGAYSELRAMFSFRLEAIDKL